ncbi:hypothetical protein Tco_0844360 [Tanacetum coccineum]
MTSSSNRRGKANTTQPWTTAEEITLCTAWCNAMETYGSGDITKKGFWVVVFDNFEKDMGGTIREYDAIVSKWKSSIRPKVAAFSVVYDGVQRMDENGSSDLINRYMLQNLDRAEEETKVTSLPLDEPLKTFTLQTLRLSSVSDKRIATILEAASEKVIDSINNRDKMIQTYQAI